VGGWVPVAWAGGCATDGMGWTWSKSRWNCVWDTSLTLYCGFFSNTGASPPSTSRIACSHSARREGTVSQTVSLCAWGWPPEAHTWRFRKVRHHHGDVMQSMLTLPQACLPGHLSRPCRIAANHRQCSQMKAMDGQGWVRAHGRAGSIGHDQEHAVIAQASHVGE
jgi:hypothetical protein